jgi:hypothetical protein
MTSPFVFAVPGTVQFSARPLGFATATADGAVYAPTHLGRFEE